MMMVAPFLPVFNALLPLAAGGLRMSYRAIPRLRDARRGRLGRSLPRPGHRVAVAGRAAAGRPQPAAGHDGGRTGAGVRRVAGGAAAVVLVVAALVHRGRWGGVRWGAGARRARSGGRLDPAPGTAGPAPVVVPVVRGRRTVGGYRSGRVRSRLVPCWGGSPAAGAPLGERGALGAERGVLAVAGVEPGLVGQPVEELVLDVVDQRREVAPRRPSVLPTPPGNRRVAGEQVRGAGRVAVEQRDRARGVARPGGSPPARTSPTAHRVAVVDASRRRPGSAAGVVGVRRAAAAPVAATTSARRVPVVQVLVGRDHRGQPAVADQLEQPVGASSAASISTCSPVARQRSR